MAGEEIVRGMVAGEEIKPSDMKRDHRTMKKRFSDSMGDPNGFMTIMGIYFGVLIILPQLGELLFFVGAWLLYYASKKEFKLPFRIPQSSGLLDPSEPDPKTQLATPAKGIAFFGNERGTKKELWFNNSDMRTHILIFGSTGSGKALRKSEMVHTPTGWKKNEDLKVGDLVSTPTGSSSVIGVFPQGELQLFKVVFEDGREIEVSGDHLWEVHYKGWIKKEIADGINKRAKVITTVQLMKEIEKGNVNSNYYVILSKEVQKPKQDLELSPYVFGASLAEGSLSYKDKVIPEIYKIGSIQQRYELVQGLMDTNGSVYKGSVEYTTISKKLAEDLAEVIQSLGGIVKISERYTNSNLGIKEQEKLNYCLHIKHPEPNKLFSLDGKKNQVLSSQYKDTLKLKITSVTALDKKEDCQCIKIADKRGLFITKDYIVTHNTEALLSLAYNALVQGSGLIYVDGKGENVLYTKIFAMARTMGREDDVLVINYMTGSRDVFGPQEKKLSNTLNPFSSGGSGGLTELMVSLMDGGDGGGDMWKGRAISLISAIMMALVYMRDAKEVLLDVDAIREYLILDNIIKLFKTRRDFPNHIRSALRAYLVSLPGFQESAPKQNDTVMEQHGYLQMQFTKLLGSLSDTYGFIFKTNLGEVDFKDVVLNRRILVVLLPALEKSTDELANLGKIIVACLKQMMASALGSTIEGSYAEVVDTKPTNADMPFMTVLDEYGYYAVKGSAVMPAQARSIGFSMIFAGQDLPAFEKASKEEAASIVANCNIKIFMKLEDPDATYSLFEKSVGEALTAQVGSMELSQGLLGSTFRANNTPNISMQKRGNLLDLKDQAPGQAHIIFTSTVIRANMFYAFAPKPPHIRMNYFVRVEPPDIAVINQMDNSLKSLLKNITNANKIKELEDNLELDNPHVDKLRELLNSHKNLNHNEASFATIAALGSEVFETYDEKIGEFRKHLEEDSESEEEINIFSAKEKKNTMNDRYRVVNEVNNFKEEDDDYMDEDEDINVFIDEDETKKGIEKIEKLGGASDEDAKDAASRAMEDLKKISKYPSDGMPTNKEPEEIMDILHELDSMFEMDDDTNEE